MYSCFCMPFLYVQVPVRAELLVSCYPVPTVSVYRLHSFVAVTDSVLLYRYCTLNYLELNVYFMTFLCQVHLHFLIIYYYRSPSDVMRLSILNWREVPFRTPRF